MFQECNHSAPCFGGRLEQRSKKRFTFRDHSKISIESSQRRVSDLSVRVDESGWISASSTSQASFGFSIRVQRAPWSLIAFTADKETVGLRIEMDVRENTKSQNDQ